MSAGKDNCRLAWFLAGAAAGVAIALSYAPQSKAKSREFLRRKSESGRGAIATTRRELIDMGRRYLEESQRIVGDIAGLLGRGRMRVSY
jgi:gas vesicle protein